LSIGAVGCYLSHIQIWASLDRELAMIFEDDTDPTLTSGEVDAILTSLPSDWDILLLGVFSEHHDRARGLSIQRIKRFYGMHAYIINRRCVPALLEIALPMRMQIDSWLSELAIKGSLRIYTISNSGWLQNTSINATDIQIPITVPSS
jgi:GR25 family glycosyltransferase involved in LPS biosynthesis